MEGIANLQTLRHTEQNKVNSVLRLLSICYQINGCYHENCRFSGSRAGFFGFSAHFTYSHSTNPIIWDCIFYVFTDKLFANLLMFHLLFLAAQFLSIKIVSQKAEKCNHIPRLFQITSHFSLILFFDMF